MTGKDFVLDAMRRQGRATALALQERSGTMDGTALCAEKDYIPAFASAVKTANMLTRPVGFVCKSGAGRVVRLLQPYDSEIYTQEPEELPAQWGVQWSKDPAMALPFMALSTSPYNEGDCCAENGGTYRSLEDGNVWAPSAYPRGWEQCGGDAE